MRVISLRAAARLNKVCFRHRCLSWGMTDALLREIHKDLSGQLAGTRRIRGYGC